jgi:hypothetical protein
MANFIALQGGMWQSIKAKDITRSSGRCIVLFSFFSTDRVVCVLVREKYVRKLSAGPSTEGIRFRCKNNVSYLWAYGEPTRGWMVTKVVASQPTRV